MLIKAKARKSDETFGFNWWFRTPKICIKAEALIYKDKLLGFIRVFRTPKNAY